MRTIWKEVLKLYDGVQHVQLPTGAIIRAVDQQQHEPTIWFECDTNAPKEDRKFLVRGTGHEAHGPLSMMTKTNSAPNSKRRNVSGMSCGVNETNGNGSASVMQIDLTR